MSDKQPIYILPEGTERMIGKDAQRNNILAAKLVADAVKTTLGPKGMDKMLVDATGEITITNDGVTILEKMEIEHPAAKMMVEISKTQEKEVGDGTTTAVMLAGKLLENAEKLLDMKIHPTVITKGYMIASEKAREFLEKVGIEITSERTDILKQIVMTAMTGKSAESVKEHLADIVVNAISQIQEQGNVDIKNVKIVKNKSGSIENTKLIQGLIIDKERVSIEMPVHVREAIIALLSEPLELKNIQESKISITSPEQMQEFLDREETMLKEMVALMKRSGATVIFCQKGIDDVVQYYLAKENIYACRRVAKSDMETIAKATGAKITSSIKELSEKDLGYADIVEEIKHGEEAMTYIQGCRNPKALTILIHGGSEHVMDEVERAVKDGLGDVAAVIKDKKIVAGAGAIEIELSRLLQNFSQSLSGREQLAVQEFARALEFIPLTLAENAGLDPIDIITELKALHDNGQAYAGINIFNNKVENVLEKGIIEPITIKKQALSSATEVAVMILRIDDVLASKQPQSVSGTGKGIEGVDE